MDFYRKSSIVIALSFSILSCDEDHVTTNSPHETVTAIQFALSEQSISENSETIDVTIDLDRPAAESGYLQVTFDSLLSNEFYTSPKSTGGILTVAIAKNVSRISFALTPFNNAISDGNKTISFAIGQSSILYKPGSRKSFRLKIQDDESPAPQSFVNFISLHHSIEENNSEWHQIKVHITEPATAQGSIVIKASSVNAKYGVHYITQPAFVNNELSLTANNTSILGLEIMLLNNETIGGNTDITFAITETNGNIVKGSNLSEPFAIKDDELIGLPKGYEVSGGNWNLRKTFEYNEHGKISKILWESYTPYHRSGTHFYQYNSSNQLIKIVTDPGQELQYSYEQNRIVKEEKVDNDVMVRYTAYAYDDAGNVTGYSSFYLQPDGSFRLSSIAVLLYYMDGNLFKKLVYAPSTSSTEPNLISTTTFEGYRDEENPFPVEDILPNVNTQKKLPTHYRYEGNGHDLLYTFSYEFLDDGRVTKRTATYGTSTEVAAYHYY